MPPKKTRKGLKWDRAQLMRKPDNLIASHQFMNIKAFVPSYEKDPHINMNFLMGWEYGRIWMEERGKWEKMMYTVSEAKVGSVLLQRKYVQHGKKAIKK